jgi:hypothetical protein
MKSGTGRDEERGETRDTVGMLSHVAPPSNISAVVTGAERHKTIIRLNHTAHNLSLPLASAVRLAGD